MTEAFDAIRSLEDNHLTHTYQRYPIAIVRGEGSRLWDVNGKEYIDYMGGYGVAILGHSNQKIKEAIRRQIDRLSILHGSLYNDTRALFAKKLVSVSPHGLNMAYLSNSGAESIEAALKVVVKFTKRKRIIAMKGSYHGKTLGALSLTFSEKYRSSFDDLVFKNVDFTEFGNLDDIVKDRKLEEYAAIFVEPVQGEGGIRIPPEGFLQGIREVCDKNGILLVVDEVQSGLCRTGKMWAHQHWNIVPDVMTIGKGIGGGIPMGVTIGKEEYMRSLELGEHSSTTGGNPIACAAGQAVLDSLVDEEIAEKATISGEKLMNGLKEDLKESRVAREVRGKGLMIAVDIRVKVQEILWKAMELGLIALYSGKTTLRLLPPLIINNDEITKGNSMLTESLKWYEKTHS